MSGVRYVWRQLTPKQREELLAWRKENKRPWHSPSHRPNFGHLNFHISAACYEHLPHIGLHSERLEDFCAALLAVFANHATCTHAWCVLPNHYHALVAAENVLRLLHELGQFHGRTSHAWNREENARGRQVFHRTTERAIRSERHFWATMNYIHNNPVHHGYVKLWTEWPWSSAHGYLETTGRQEADRIWREFPLLQYGQKWDPPER
ncbi:MAG: hypothetical protein O2960_21555 [Verrucomicrobia bacterium]|nr:hypothetical protein [Verrucomicrobiota bacterium]